MVVLQGQCSGKIFFNAAIAAGLSIPGVSLAIPVNPTIIKHRGLK
jgi:hypothetical protein